MFYVPVVSAVTPVFLEEFIFSWIHKLISNMICSQRQLQLLDQSSFSSALLPDDNTGEQHKKYWWGTLNILNRFSFHSEVTSSVGNHICLHFFLNKESCQVVFTCIWAKILEMGCNVPCAGAFYLCSWKPQCTVWRYPQVTKSNRNLEEKRKGEESGLLYWQEKMKFEENAVCFWGIVLIWNFISRKSSRFWPQNK